MAIKVSEDDLVKFFKSQTFNFDEADELLAINDIVAILESHKCEILGTTTCCPPDEFLQGDGVCNSDDGFEDEDQSAMCQRCWEQILK